MDSIVRLEEIAEERLMAAQDRIEIISYVLKDDPFGTLKTYDDLHLSAARINAWNYVKRMIKENNSIEQIARLLQAQVLIGSIQKEKTTNPSANLVQRELLCAYGEACAVVMSIA